MRITCRWRASWTTHYYLILNSTVKNCNFCPFLAKSSNLTILLIFNHFWPNLVNFFSSNQKSFISNFYFFWDKKKIQEAISTYSDLWPILMGLTLAAHILDTFPIPRYRKTFSNSSHYYTKDYSAILSQSINHKLPESSENE